MDADGKLQLLRIEADTPAMAVADIRARGLTLLAVEESTERSGLNLDVTRWLPLSNKDKVLLFRMLATLVRSEVTITQAIRILKEQSDRANVKRLLGNILARIESGIPLSEAMAAQARVFHPSITNLIRAGEISGTLDSVFERISFFLEGKADLQRKLVSAFFYPAIVLVAGIGVVVFLVLFVIPRFMGMIAGNVPPPTQFLLDITEYLQMHGIDILAYAGGGVALLVIMQAIPTTRYYLDRYKIYLPIVGTVIRLGIVTNFARTLSLLLESRIPMVEALRATNATLSNTAVNQLLDDMEKRLAGGETLSQCIREAWIFTPLTASMASIGEHSGLMGESMQTVAEVHAKILEDKISNMSAMVEPALIITLGAVVGFVVYALIIGMLAMY